MGVPAVFMVLVLSHMNLRIFCVVSVLNIVARSDIAVISSRGMYVMSVLKERLYLCSYFVIYIYFSVLIFG